MHINQSFLYLMAQQDGTIASCVTEMMNGIRPVRLARSSVGEVGKSGYMDMGIF